MDGERIARRSVAFFLIKSGVNFLAVALLGTALAVGLFGPELSLWLTAFPAALAALTIAAVAAIPASVPGRSPDPDASRLRRGLSAARRAVVDGSAEARQILRSGNRRVLAGSAGYWAFDNAVLWATFHAFGLSPPLTVILMGYLIGQLGGLLPIPGGIGGIDGGLIGTLIVYGAPAAGTAAAVLAYRIVLFSACRRGGRTSVSFSIVVVLAALDNAAKELSQVRVELGAGPAADLGQGVLPIARGRVGALSAHRVEGVADQDDPGPERDLLARQAVRIAARHPSARARSGRGGRPGPATGRRR